MPRDSRLPPEDVERFYRIWNSLLGWAGVQKQIAVDSADTVSAAEALAVRHALWADNTLRHAWIDANPDALPPEDLALVKSWDHRVADRFFIVKHYAGHSIFLGGQNQAFAVLGLVTPLRDMAPELPVLVEAVLIPYDGRITYDGLLSGLPILFGSGMRRSLAGEFKRIQERGEVLHSLEPGAAPSVEETAKLARKANTSILGAYSTALRAERHPDAIHARDLAVAEWLAVSVGPDRSLAMLHAEDFERLVASSARGPFHRSELLTSLKRFVVFLAQSERMDWKVADDVHRWLRAQGRRRS